MRRVIYLYILTMPFVSAFAISEHLNIPLIISILLTFIIPINIIIKKKGSYSKSGIHSKFIILWIFILTISYLYNCFEEVTQTNHLFAYYTVFICQFLTIQYWLVYNNKDAEFLKKIFLYLSITLIISSVFGCIEYYLNTKNISIDNYIPRVMVQNFDAEGLSGIYRMKRIRSFAEESGHFAFMIEIFAPLMIYYLFFSGYVKKYKWFKVIVSFIVIFSFIFTLSAAAFINIPIAICLTLILSWKSLIGTLKKFLAKNLVLIFIFISILYYPLNILYKFIIYDKIYSNSVMDRSSRLDAFIKIFPQAPPINILIGYGPSGYKTAGLSYAFVSLFPTILFESGTLGFLLFIFALIYIFNQLLNISGNVRFFLLISFISGSLHYLVIGNYWYPWYWFLCAMIIMIKNKELYENMYINRK